MNFLTNVQAAEWILNLAFTSIVIVGIGWFFGRIFRRKAAPLKSGLILMILAILTLLPVLNLQPVMPHLNPLQITLPISISSSVGSSAGSFSGEVAGVTSETLSLDTKKTKFLPPISGLSLIRIINGFGIIWGLGFLVCLIRFIYGTRALCRFKNGLVEMNDTKAAMILKLVENTFRKHIRFKVFLSDSLTTPIVMGLFRPIVVIPRSFYIKWNENTIRGILLHELSHIYHRDNFTGILQKLAVSLNWWNPFVYNISASFSRAREEISDNHVLLENNSRDYAECLISLAENKCFKNRFAVFTTMTSPHIPLNDRIKYILSKERRMDTHLKKSSVLLILVVFVFLLGLTAGNILTFAATTESIPTPESIGAAAVLPQEQDKIKPPKLLKKVEPVYPKIAIDAHIEGTVTVEATTDIYGRVQRIKVLRSVPILDQAAVDAVKQWVYEPMQIDGKPRGVIFTIKCKFQLGEKVKVDVETIESGTKVPPLPDKVKEGVVGGVMGGVVGGVVGGVAGEAEGPVRAVGDIKPPKLIKRVEPVFPEAAREAGIEGVVIVEATTGIYGRVQNVKILRSIPPLDQAAVDAVYQWVYEPSVVNGKPTGMVFTVTVIFKLKEETKDSGPVRAVGDIKPPKLIKRVDPVYPEEAKKAGIEGVVIVEATTGIYGRVQNVKVLRSIPPLDQAAVDAVYQWVYEPALINGKPRGVIFTVTVTFNIK